MHKDGYFYEHIAETYDRDLAYKFDPEIVNPTVDFLADLAGDGRALELGSGTGRITLPLARRGVLVAGIEMSVAMTDRLRAKPGGEEIDITIGDFATASVDGLFRVAYLVFGTISNLTTQAAQVACFRNVAAHLEPGGYFVIEVGIPKLQHLPYGETVRPFQVDEDYLGFDEYNLAEQGLISHHFRLVDGNWERFSSPFRYVWPSELDLMAELAGMKPYERWSGWNREAFTSDSLSLVAVWHTPTL